MAELHAGMPAVLAHLEAKWKADVAALHGLLQSKRLEFVEHQRLLYEIQAAAAAIDSLSGKPAPAPVVAAPPPAPAAAAPTPVSATLGPLRTSLRDQAAAIPDRPAPLDP